MKLEIKSATDDTGFDVFMGDKKIGIIRDEDWLEGERMTDSPVILYAFIFLPWALRRDMTAECETVIESVLGKYALYMNRLRGIMQPIEAWKIALDIVEY